MELLIYLLRVSACMAIFYVLYVVGLRRLTFFRVNRFYLLFSLAISFVIPMVRFTITRELPDVVEEKNQLPVQVIAGNSMPTQPIPTMIEESNNFVQLHWENIVLVIYLAVSLILFAMCNWLL